MLAGEIINPTQEPDHRLRRLFLRVGVPVLAVILVVIVVVGISIRSYNATRNGILRLTQVILNSEQSRISQEVANYLRPATSDSILAIDMLSHIPIEYKRGMFYSYAMSSLRQVKQIQSFHIANDNGEFALVDRSNMQKDRVEIITLQPDNKGGQFLRESRTTQGKKLDQGLSPANAYDPRKREWYKNAVAAGELTWSAPYVVPSLKQLVITASIPFTDQNGLKNVFAVNISLNQLTSFLSSLHISKNSVALIMDRKGNIVASRDMLLKVGQPGWDPADNKIDPKVNPVLARAYDVFRVNGYGVHNIKINKTNYISIAAQLPKSAQNWVVMIVMPERDFSEFAVADGKQNLLFSLLVVALAAIMAGLLVWQGRKMEALGRSFRFIQELGRREVHALENISVKPEVFASDHEALIFSEELSRLTLARRVSIWRLIHHGQALLSEDVFDRENGTHSGGVEYSNIEIPDFFKLLDQSEIIQIDQADKDQRVQHFYLLFMQSIKSSKLLVVPIQGKKGVIGVILLEDSPFVHQTMHMIKIFASLISMRFEINEDYHDEQEMGSSTSGKDSGEPGISWLTQTMHEDILKHEKGNKDNYLIAPHVEHEGLKDFDPDKPLPDKIFPHVSVMNLIFSGNMDPQADLSEQQVENVEKLAVNLQEIANKYGLFYLKVMGGHIVAVAGCSKTFDPTAPVRLAHAALDIRSACIELIATTQSDSSFGIGIAVGPAMGTWLGKDPQVFNLWGPTVMRASLMAGMAREGGTIQVTESAYAFLRKDFLFRPRGSFFVPKVGVSRTFILAGRR